MATELAGEPSGRKGRGRPAKLKQSQWFVTINLNKRDSPEVRKAVRGVIQEIFNSAITADRKYINGKLESMDIEATFDPVPCREVNSRCLQAYLLIRAKHYGKLSIDFKALKIHIAVDLGLSGNGIRLKSENIHDNNATLVDYINRK